MNTLLAVDGSEQSYDAARALAGLSSAGELTVLTAVSVPGLPDALTGAGLSTDLVLEVEAAMKEEAEQLLERVQSILPSWTGPIHTQLVLGEPAERILTVARDRGVDVIVMGARGLSQLEEQFMGSVSHRVMTHAPCSTFVVTHPLREIRHVLAPLANREDGDAIVGFLRKAPFRGSVRVTVLHVVPFAPPVTPVGALIPDTVRADVLAQSKQMVKDVAEQIQALGHTATSAAVMGLPSNVIAAAVKEHAPDLVLMRTHSRSGISRFLLGSVSHSVLHHAACSVLLVRGPA